MHSPVSGTEKDSSSSANSCASSDIHPEHALVSRAVRDWFHLPYQGMGYRAEQRKWGSYWSSGWIYISQLPSHQVQSFLTDARTYFADAPGPVLVCIDDPDRDAKLRPFLLEGGCQIDDTDLFLTHVGSVAQQPVIEGLTTEPVNDANLHQLAITKLKAFPSTEQEPEQEQVEREIARRQREMSGLAKGVLAYVDQEPAGFITWYDDPKDLWVKLLGTRVPFRRQGIAAWLLLGCVQAAYQQGCRSVVLDVSATNAALYLYKRLGFRDQVYWRQCYTLEI